MPTNDEVLQEGMIAAFCETHGVDPDTMTDRAKELVIERLKIMREAREKYTFLMNQLGPVAPNPPGQLDYLTFMLDALVPPGTERRLELDLQFAQFNLDGANEGIANMEQARRPKLHLPSTGETMQVNWVKPPEGGAL